MALIKKRFLLLLFGLLFLLDISCSSKATVKYIKSDSYIPGDYFVIWAHSDIQPRKLSERKYYETAIDDINNNFPKVDIALVAGDLIHWPNSGPVYKWYVETKQKSNIKYWYEIAGNHDWQDYKNYEAYINLPIDYSVSIGNTLILCMSDEDKTSIQEISDGAFNWWKNIVINNQDKIIITMTHAYLKESNMFGTLMPSRNIKDSKRFAEVLKEYKVDIWICGHMHLSHLLLKSLKKVDNLNGTIFVNVSTIRGGQYNGSESFLFYFKKNSDKFIIKSRDHEEQKFNIDDSQFTLSKKFVWDGNHPVLEEMTR